MGKADMRKCCHCGKELNIKEELYEKIKKRYIHIDCYKFHKEEEEEKERQRKQLFDYIETLYGEVPSRICRQINEFIREGKTYEGIYFALYYFHHAKQNPPWKTSPTIGIVPHIYEEANNHYNTLREKMRKAQEENLKITNPPKAKKIIKKKASSPNKKSGNVRKFKMLDDEE